MPTPRLYDPTTCDALRRDTVRDLVWPQVRRVWGAYPLLQSACLLVAQYWDDEARDAVHGRLLFSKATSIGPAELAVWATRCAAAARLVRSGSDNPLHCDDDEALTWLDGGVDLAIELDANPYGDQGYVRWDDNHEAIPLFAAFCPEGAHQEQDVCEAYAPYATFRRDTNRVEVIGTMLRPWLDGVRPTWSAP